MFKKLLDCQSPLVWYIYNLLALSVIKYTVHTAKNQTVQKDMIQITVIWFYQKTHVYIFVHSNWFLLPLDTECGLKYLVNSIIYMKYP